MHYDDYDLCKTVRKVKLTGGNLVLDNPVPTKYLDRLPNKESHEFTHMRYTAATCDPSEFVENKYQLRQNLLNRETELFIVLTMYNVRQKNILTSFLVQFMAAKQKEEL